MLKQVSLITNLYVLIYLIQIQFYEVCPNSDRAVCYTACYDNLDQICSFMEADLRSVQERVRKCDILRKIIPTPRCQFKSS